jgi:hypothetical protein
VQWLVVYALSPGAPSSTGSFAIFTAIHHASSRVSNLAALGG